jgi:3-methyladenine DNA glycosylase AlkD
VRVREITRARRGDRIRGVSRVTARNSARAPARGANTAPRVAAVIADLRRLGSAKGRAGMARYAIPSDKAFGASVGSIRKLAKSLGRSHELAAALWASGWYEARMLAAFVDEPDRVTPSQMDRWRADFDNWAICDTACFHLFDKTPHALGRVRSWARLKGEFDRRAAFALLASVAAHDRTTSDAPFAGCLGLIERAAEDDRNFVKKGVSWALRVVGRRSPELHAGSLALARCLAESDSAPARWIGRDALRDLAKPSVVRKLASKQPKAAAARRAR